jgi:tetratricopeptide (TPR) repeat protein
LLTKSPLDAGWRRDLSAGQERVGDILLRQGHHSRALVEFRASFDIRKRLFVQEPSNAIWYRDLAVSHEKIGDVFVSKNDNAKALIEYRASYDIRRRLSEQDPNNVGWQTDVAASCWRIAHIVDRPTPAGRTEAIERLQEALAILQRLDEAGRLVPYWKGWIPRYQAALEQIRSTS